MCTRWKEFANEQAPPFRRRTGCVHRAGAGQGFPADRRNQASLGYNPIINAADFSPVVSNKYCTLKLGMKAGYEQVTSKGLTLKQIDVAGDTKSVMGITTLVVRQREWLNGRLLEDARGWVAQDKHGNVWYFGEAVNYYRDGKPVHHDSSWEAGVDGAKPGILMFNEPKIGASYRREYHAGRAEDRGTVIAVGMSVTVPQGPFFQNCVHIREWSPLKEAKSSTNITAPALQPWFSSKKVQAGCSS